MPTFAAIDIGSNSCRLKIATVHAHRLKTLHEDREVTRLGESVFQTGVISPEAMAGTIRALKRFHKAVQLHVVDKVRIVATSATKLLSAWAFDVLHLARIEITVDPRNTASQRVALTAGFTHEGTLRSYQRFKDGRMDAVMFSRLPGDR